MIYRRLWRGIMRDYVVFSDVSKYYQMGQMVIKAIDHINV